MKDEKNISAFETLKILKKKDSDKIFLKLNKNLNDNNKIN